MYNDDDGADADPCRDYDDGRLEAKATRSVQLRRYLPSLSDLVDRLTIVQQKVIFIPDNAAAYEREMSDIEHDIDIILNESAIRLNAAAVRAIIVIMLTNRFIWENESKARAGGNGHDKLLKLTHSINGVRNTAKNKLAAIMGGRLDYKIDCFAAELVDQFGNWNVFGDGNGTQGEVHKSGEEADSST